MAPQFLGEKLAAMKKLWNDANNEAKQRLDDLKNNAGCWNAFAEKCALLQTQVSNCQKQIASKGEKRMSKLLTTMWSNFMKYGNPTPRPVEKIKWLPSSEVKREYLVIGKETKMASSLSLLRRLSIWKAVLGED